jgi:ketosteroid isomerase-like protein
MKKIIVVLALLCCTASLYSQDKNIEKEIKALEQTEVKAVLEKDSTTLLKLWDENFVVNAPANIVVFAGKTTLDRPVLKQARAGFTREVEQIIVRDNVVFSMGSETVTPENNNNASAQTIKRRYTNIWMNKNGSWKLVARHANVICKDK